MPSSHWVHTGKIVHQSKTVTVVIKPTQHQLLCELNNWLFDYLYANQLPIASLPPLDDWTRSPENHRQWSVQWPTDDWTVSIESELLVFK